MHDNARSRLKTSRKKAKKSKAAAKFFFQKRDDFSSFYYRYKILTHTHKHINDTTTTTETRDHTTLRLLSLFNHQQATQRSHDICGTYFKRFMALSSSSSSSGSSSSSVDVAFSPFSCAAIEKLRTRFPVDSDFKRFSLDHFDIDVNRVILKEQLAKGSYGVVYAGSYKCVESHCEHCVCCICCKLGHARVCT
jgi:hypothetical protein